MSFTEAEIEAAVEGIDWHACTCRPDCPASRRGHPCGEWMGYAPPGEAEMRFCPCCGWSRRWHPEGPAEPPSVHPVTLIPGQLVAIGAARSGFRLQPVETATTRDGLL